MNMRDYATITESDGQESSLLRPGRASLGTNNNSQDDSKDQTLTKIVQARAEYEKTMLQIFPDFPVMKINSYEEFAKQINDQT